MSACEIDGTTGASRWVCESTCTEDQECCGGRCVARCDAAKCETCDAASGSCRSTCNNGTCQTCASGACVNACVDGYTCCRGVNPGDPAACVCQPGQKCTANGRGGEVCCPDNPNAIGCGVTCCHVDVGCADPVNSVCN